MPLIIPEQVRLPFDNLVNWYFGTWHVSGGLPDVVENPNYAEKHQQRIAQGESQSWPYIRAGSMVALELVAKTSEAIKPNIVNRPADGIYFYDANDDQTSLEAAKKTRSLFFPGSGIDRLRNHNVGIHDLQTYMGTMIGQAIGEFGDKGISTKVDVANLPQTYTYLYESKPEAWFTRLKEAYLLNAKPDMYGPQQQKFCEALLLDGIARTIERDAKGNPVRDSKTGRIKCSGKFDPETLAKNLRYTWGAQSYGATFCHQVINCLKEYMQDVGYSDKEIATGIRNIFILSISGAMPVIADGPSPTVVAVEDIKDFVAFQMNRQGVYPNEKQQMNFRVNGNPHELVVSPDRRFFWMDNHWKSDQHPQGTPKPEGDVYGYHDIRIVLNNLPEPVKRAWVRSMDRSENVSRLPALEQLLEPEIGHEIAHKGDWSKTAINPQNKQRNLGMQ